MRKGTEISKDEIIEVVVEDIKQGGVIARTILRAIQDAVKNGHRLFQSGPPQRGAGFQLRSRA